MNHRSHEAPLPVVDAPQSTPAEVSGEVTRKPSAASLLFGPLPLTDPIHFQDEATSSDERVAPVPPTNLTSDPGSSSDGSSEADNGRDVREATNRSAEELSSEPGELSHEEDLHSPLPLLRERQDIQIILRAVGEALWRSLPENLPEEEIHRIAARVAGAASRWFQETGVLLSADQIIDRMIVRGTELGAAFHPELANILSGIEPLVTQPSENNLPRPSSDTEGIKVSESAALEPLSSPSLAGNSNQTRTSHPVTIKLSAEMWKQLERLAQQGLPRVRVAETALREYMQRYSDLGELPANLTLFEEGRIRGQIAVPSELWETLARFAADKNRTASIIVTAAVADYLRACLTPQSGQ